MPKGRTDLQKRKVLMFSQAKHERRSMKKILILTVLATLLLSVSFVSSASAATDTCTWTGAGADADWATPANWDCSIDGSGVAPELNDSLVFPAGAARTTNNNNFVAGTTFESISITGAGYQLGGNAVNLQPTSSTAIQITGNNNEIVFNVEVESTGASKVISNSGTGNVLTGGVTLNITGGADMNLLSNAGGVLEIGAITGTTQSFVLNTATGRIILSGTNTYTATGSVYNLVDGVVECETSSCFGNSSNAVILTGNSETRFIGGSLTIPQNISSTAGANSPVIALGGGSNVFDGNLDINSNFNVVVNDTSTGNDLNGDIDIAADTILDISGEGDYSSSAITINNGAITGSGDIQCGDVGVDLIGTSPAYAGDVIVNAECLLTVLGQSLGTTAGDVTVNDGGVLRTALGGTTDTIDDDINIEGAGHSAGFYSGCAYFLEGDDVDFTGTINLTAETNMCLNNNLGGSADFQGVITGTGPLNLTELDEDSGSFLMTGTSINDYAGTTNVTDTRLLLAKDPGGLGVPGLLNLEATGNVNARIDVSNTGGDNIADISIVSLTNAVGFSGLAVFESSDQDEVIGSIVGNGHIESDGASYGFTIGGENSFGTFSGTFDDEEGTITKIGNDYWELDSSVSYPGNPATPFEIVIEEGSIVWDATLPEMPVTIAGGTLKGSGDTGNLNSATGVLAPGNSPGCISSGETSLASGSSFAVEINGATVCSGYDQLIAEDIAINNATLTIDFGYTPSVGTQFTIIDAGTVTGSFAGLADNAEFVADGQRLRIDYQAEAVVLTSLGPASTAAGGSLPSTGSGILDAILVSMMLIAVGSAIGFGLYQRRRIHIV